MHWGEKIRNIRETAFFTELKLQKEASSPARNRTPVSRVTGGDTHHYTTEESDGIIALNLILRPSSGKNEFLPVTQYFLRDMIEPVADDAVLRRK